MPPFLLLLLLVASAFAKEECVPCGGGDEDYSDEEEYANAEAELLAQIEQSLPAEAKAAIARRDVLWFGLGAVNFELMPSEKEMEEMVEVQEEEGESNPQSASQQEAAIKGGGGQAGNDGDVSSQHHSWIILFGVALIGLLILVGSFMVANAYFNRLALKSRLRAAQGRLARAGGGGSPLSTSRQESSFYRPPPPPPTSPVTTFSTD